MERSSESCLCFCLPRSASYKLGQMILPQLEAGTHGVEVVGMFFFDDNNYMLRAGDPIGERLAKVAAEKGMLLMLCDMCALERGLATGEPAGATPTAWAARSRARRRQGTVAGCRSAASPTSTRRWRGICRIR